MGCKRKRKIKGNSRVSGLSCSVDPLPTEQVQRLNLNLHGYQLGSLPLSRNRNCKNSTRDMLIWESFFLFMATPTTYGSSWARGRIVATAGAQATDKAMMDQSHICNIHYSLQRCQILNPLSETRERTRILTETCWVLNLLSHSGNSWNLTRYQSGDTEQKIG